MRIATVVAHTLSQAAWLGVSTRFGRHRHWPSRALLLDEPLALAEERTHRLRRIYANAGRDAWDGPRLFREAVAKHDGIQLEHDKRVALAQVLNILMWGELAAWIVSAELAEGLEDADARLAASSQVFDEARHFYVLRDYMALLHVPVPPLDPLFTTGVRSVLASKDLVVKLMAIQILAEGGATAIFRSLLDHQVEPVLCELLPYIERDESRHVGLGVLHLPKLLAEMSPRQWKRLRARMLGVANLIAGANYRNAESYRSLGIDPREMARRTDKMGYELIIKLGKAPRSDEWVLPVVPVDTPEYQRNLEIMFPEPGERPHWFHRLVHRVIRGAERALPN